MNKGLENLLCHKPKFMVLVDDLLKMEDLTQLSMPEDLDWNQLLETAFPDSHQRLEYHPSFSWSLMISVLRRANKTEAERFLMRRFHVKGAITSMCILIQSATELHSFRLSGDQEKY